MSFYAFVNLIGELQECEFFIHLILIHGLQHLGSFHAASRCNVKCNCWQNFGCVLRYIRRPREYNNTITSMFCATQETQSIDNSDPIILHVPGNIILRTLVIELYYV